MPLEIQIFGSNIATEYSGVPTGAGGAARPGCHSLGGDTQSMDQYLRNDTNGA